LLACFIQEGHEGPGLLWSQIKLTSYAFSDMHINGEFDNRLGTGFFLRIFSCVVTYRTGAGRRLYMSRDHVVDRRVFVGGTKLWFKMQILDFFSKKKTPIDSVSNLLHATKSPKCQK